MSIRPRPPSAVSSLRLLSLLCIAVPLALYGVVAAYRYQQLREETNLRLDRALRIAQEHALRVIEGRHVRARPADAAAGDELQASFFQAFQRDLMADEPGMAITMFRRDGTVISRWPALPNAPAALSPGSPVMKRVQAGETGGPAHGVSSLDGRERLLFFREVGDYPVYVGTGMDVAEIQARWAREMALLAALGAPPLVALFILARVALRRTRNSLATAERLGQETQARLRVEEALLQAQKLEALGRLTGGVAHDFNNALMVISNSLYLHQQKFPQAQSTHLESIGRAVESATRLTRQLLAFSRRQALVPQHISLQETLPALRDLLEPVLGRQVELRIEVDAAISPIVADSAELELALINLAINARDAMPSGGRFRLEARDAGQLLAAREGPMVVIEAHDTGTGIPPELLSKVFEPFFTTKDVGQGTGLGLSQVYALCQRAGGLASIDSTPGEGTAVRMFFPAAAVSAPQPTPAPAVPRSSACRLLLVEDNDEVARSLQQVLESIGCQVVRRRNALDAREWLAAHPDGAEVMLTDVVMPGEMDGLDLARHVRAQHPRIGTLLITGHAEQMDAIGRLGFAVLPKPSTAQALADAIDKVRSSEGESP